MHPLQEAKKNGWPLTVQDILMERINFEDRLRSKEQTVVHDEKVMKKELPSQTWSPTSRYIFSRNIMRFAESLIA